MKSISLISCIFLILLTTANAENVIKCIDSNGNIVLTSSPQDGMKCETGESIEEAKDQKKSPKVNLIEYCNKLSTELDDSRDKMKETENERSELNKEIDIIRENGYRYHWSYDVQSKEIEPIRKKIQILSDQYSALSHKQNEIRENLVSYKCEQLKNDLARIQSQTYEDYRNRRYRK